MGILDNFENAWDEEFSFESKPMPVIDNLGNKVLYDQQSDTINI
jgi:hypothetical protein